MIDLKPTFWVNYNGKRPLQAIRLYGDQHADPSDLAKILGATQDQLIETSARPMHKYCTDYWVGNYDHVCGLIGMVSTCFRYSRGDRHDRKIAARPFLPPSSTRKIPLKDILSLHKIEYSPELKITPLPVSRLRYGRRSNKLRIAKYGEFPQTVADMDVTKQLDNLLEYNSLKPTGKQYTFDPSEGIPEKPCFVPYNEYEYDNNRYIRIKSTYPDRTHSITRHFHDGRVVRPKEIYWVRVTPIEWLVDPSGWWIAKDCLFAGIPFDLAIPAPRESSYWPRQLYQEYGENFEETNINYYLQNYFAKEIQPLGR